MVLRYGIPFWKATSYGDLTNPVRQPARRVQDRTVGKVYDDLQVKIADDGEIWSSPRSSKVTGVAGRDPRSFVDGWFKTGDIAHRPVKASSPSQTARRPAQDSGGKFIAPQPLKMR